jgi:2-keto-4-pentenoate hydratase
VRIEEATLQQLGHWRAALGSGALRVGWKIGFNVPAVREKLGLDRPALGHLTSATLIGPEATHSLAGAANPLVEPEIAVEVGADGSIASVAAAIEVVDMAALPDPTTVGEAVANNIFHRAFALGRARPRDALAGAEALLSVNGEERGRADAGGYDLEGMLAAAAEILDSAGESLEPGDRLIAGTLTAPAPVGAGDRVTVEIGPLGSVEVEFTE